jgi:molybdenum cofactor biosynthesis enzyme MoaA
MEIQSLSIVVPASCPNNCPFCVSHMNKENRVFKNKSHEKSFWKMYERRMAFARDNGCNTMIITSTGEATQNPEFVKKVLEINSKLDKPFRWIELQTSGVGLIEMFDKYPEIVTEISTVSLSVVDIFNNISNTSIMRMPEYLHVNDMIEYLKDNNFTVRISLNMTKILHETTPEYIMKRLKNLNVDQITFRVLYKSPYPSKENDWIDVNTISKEFIEKLNDFIKTNGRRLERLPFGAVKYSIDGISTVLDDDCMATEDKEAIRYLILRTDAKLYSKWDDKGSLIF